MDPWISPTMMSRWEGRVVELEREWEGRVEKVRKWEWGEGTEGEHVGESFSFELIG